MQQPPFAGTPLQPSSAQQQGKGFSRGMMILLVAVALLMISSGISLICYTIVAHPAQLRVQATATVESVLNADAHSTAIANGYATATARVQANATATMQVQATAQAQATANTFQNIYTKATSGIPVLHSSLAFQDRYNWDIYSTTDEGSCTFTGGALHASAFAKGFYVPCFAHATNFSNFAYQVQMTIHEGDEGGIVFRADDANSRYYFLRVGGDGFYSLYISKDDKHNLAIAYATSTAIHTAPNQPNLLTVIAQGDSFSLYINKQYVGSAHDGSYSSGEIGVYAADNNNRTDVSFSNAQVWSL
jgi:hypothetical protein